MKLFKRLNDSTWSRWIFSPFSTNIWLFVTLIILFAGIDLVCRIGNGSLTYSFKMLMWDIVTAYILAVPAGIKPKSVLSKIYTIVVLVLASFLCLEDFVCWRVLHTEFTIDYPEIIKATNISEFMGYADTVLNIRAVAEITVFIIAIVLIAWFMAKRVKQVSLKAVAIMSVSMVIIFGYCILNHISLDYFAGGKIWIWYKTLTRNTPNLRDYPTDAIITADLNLLPKNLVLVIGESFNKQHSSLYGYEKPTNPCLEAYRDSDNLVVFDRVESAGIQTIACFKSILTDYRGKDDPRNWWECTKLVEVLDKSGYTTRWISNQSPSGFNESVQSAFAKLSDEVIYVGDISKGLRKKDLDEIVLPPLDSISTHCEASSLNAYIVHLAGSHEHFAWRYPQDEAIFSIDEYSQYPTNQRLILSQYDNSVRYNDKVVASIIDIFKDKDALLIYMPDHGLDLFHTNPDIAAHARFNDPESVKYSRQIPFVIFPTDTYLSRCPEKKSQISSLSHEYLDTTDFMAFLLDLCGISIEPNKPS